MHDHDPVNMQRAVQRFQVFHRSGAWRVQPFGGKGELVIWAKDMGMGVAGIARHLESGRGVRDAENAICRGASHQAWISWTCFAFSVMAASRNWMSVPVDIIRAPMATNSAASFGRVDKPPTPTCLSCLRQAVMVRA